MQIWPNRKFTHKNVFQDSFTYSSYESECLIRWVTIREKWFCHVVGDSEAHDGVGGGDEDEDGVP